MKKISRTRPAALRGKAAAKPAPGNSGSDAEPAVLRFMAEALDPVAVFLALSGRTKGACLLESAAETEFSAETSAVTAAMTATKIALIALEPEFRLVSDSGRSRVEGLHGPPLLPGESPFAWLRRVLAARKSADPRIPAASGGAIGYAGFDFSLQLDPGLPRSAKPGAPGHDLSLSFHRILIEIDPQRSQVTIAVRPRPGVPAERARQEAERDAKTIAARVRAAPTATRLGRFSPVKFTSRLRGDDFLNAVSASREAIVGGHFYNVVLAQPFFVRSPLAPFLLYRRLRRAFQTPYHYFFDLPECAVAGASPDGLLYSNGRRAEVRVCSGLRPRGDTREADEHAARELQCEIKESAEHHQLVDLARNDLSAVCVPGSVRLAEFKAVQRLPGSQQLFSRVTGQLAPGRDALDAFAAVFPSGAVSGMPRRRALATIEAVEPVRRGVYGGAVLVLMPNGRLESCVALQQLAVHAGVIWAITSAGVSSESVPESESRDCMNKLTRLQNAAAGGEAAP